MSAFAPESGHEPFVTACRLVPGPDVSLNPTGLDPAGPQCGGSEVRIILARGAKPADLSVERMCYHSRPAQSLRAPFRFRTISPLARDLPRLCGEVSCGKPAGAGVGENHVGCETAQVYDAARQGSGGRRGLAAPCKSERQPGDDEARPLHARIRAAR